MKSPLCWLIAAFSVVDFAGAHIWWPPAVCPPPPWCEKVGDPCQDAKCRIHPRAVCIPNYCYGRCDPVFYLNGRSVDCRSDACPAPTKGPCVEACKDCEKKGMICCPTECGHACTKPRRPHCPANTQLPSSGACPEIVDKCNSCLLSRKFCCQTGCVMSCTWPVWY